MYASLLFWLALALPGYVLVRRFYKKDLESGLLGTVGLSYLAVFGLLSPVSIACHLLRLPLWVFSATCVLAVIGAAIEITRKHWWRDTGKLVAGGLSFELLIVAVDMLIGARVGPNPGGDSVLHLTRIRVLLDHGFNNYDPFVAERFFFPIYHTNILHSLYATCSQLTGVHHIFVWFVSIVWGKLLIASGAYYMVWCVFDRRWVAAVAAVFTVACQGPVTFIVYPNKLAPLWLLAMMIGFAVQACKSPCAWGSPLKLGIGSLVIGQVHSLYGAFAGVALAPTLMCVGLARLIRHRSDGWRLVVCTLALTAALPFLLVSKLGANLTSNPPKGTETAAKHDSEPHASERTWSTMGPRSGWGTVHGWRSACLGLGIVCALVGSRRRQAAVLLAIASTVALVFYVSPVCTAALQVLERKWILSRMGIVLYLGFVGLVPSAMAFLIEPLTRIGWAQWAFQAIGGRRNTGTGRDQRPKERVETRQMPRRPDAHRFESAAYRAVVSLLALTLGIVYINHKAPYTWTEHFEDVRAPREVRHQYLDFSRRVVAFCRGNIPPGETVLIGEYQGMFLTSTHDSYIVAPKRGGNGIPDWGERRKDLEIMLAPDTPWEARRTLLRKYDVHYFFPSGESVEWVRGHVRQYPTVRDLPLYILDTSG